MNCPHCNQPIEASAIPDAVLYAETGRRWAIKRKTVYRGGRKPGAKDVKQRTRSKLVKPAP